MCLIESLASRNVTRHNENGHHDKIDRRNRFTNAILLAMLKNKFQERPAVRGTYREPAPSGSL